MTYLEIVNKVLLLLREPAAATLAVGEDVVVDVVAQHVNDAKRSVENAHNWNALRYDWVVLPGPGSAKVELAGTAGVGVNIEEAYGPDGLRLTENSSSMLRAKTLRAQSPGDFCTDFAINGISPTTRNVLVEFYPEPAQIESIKVFGWKKQPDLSLASDILLVPHQPVVYLALALAARERGEVGGQTASEIFGMASNYLSDAIAQDVALNQYDYDWHVG